MPGKGPKFIMHPEAETGAEPVPQLYDLSIELGERRNLAAADPERVKRMAEILEKIRGAVPVRRD